MGKRFIGNVKGVGITTFAWEYYLSSSSTVLDGGSWSATPPTLGNRKYLWLRAKVTLTDGTTQYTVPFCEGVWEEIYGIYDEGAKIDGALEDIAALKVHTHTNFPQDVTFEEDIYLNDSTLETLWTSVFG